MSLHARITGTGAALPSLEVPNAVYDARFGAGVGDWLVKNTGIHSRFHLAPGETVSDLAAAAGARALARAGLRVDQVQRIIVATDTPDQPSPATAAVVAFKLGAPRGVGVFDLNTACAGFVTALELGTQALRGEPALKHLLIIGAYGMSRFLDPADKSTATLFADGAGAVVLSASDTQGYLSSTLWSDPSMWEALGIFDGGATRPAGGAVQPAVKFVKKFPGSFNTEHWPRMLRESADKAGVGLSQVDLFLFTQLNLRTIEAVMAQLELPLTRTHWVMDKWGYTGSACIPMALDDALAQGKLKPGGLLALCASGGGVAMASAFFRWSP